MFFFLSFFVGLETQENKKERKTSQKRKKNVFLNYWCGKKEKTEVGDEDGEGVKTNPEEIWSYFFRILLNSFPN